MHRAVCYNTDAVRDAVLSSSPVSKLLSAMQPSNRSLIRTKCVSKCVLHTAGTAWLPTRLVQQQPSRICTHAHMSVQMATLLLKPPHRHRNFQFLHCMNSRGTEKQLFKMSTTWRRWDSMAESLASAVACRNCGDAAHNTSRCHSDVSSPTPTRVHCQSRARLSRAARARMACVPCLSCLVVTDSLTASVSMSHLTIVHLRGGFEEVPLCRRRRSSIERSIRFDAAFSRSSRSSATRSPRRLPRIYERYADCRMYHLVRRDVLADTNLQANGALIENAIALASYAYLHQAYIQLHTSGQCRV